MIHFSITIDIKSHHLSRATRKNKAKGSEIEALKRLKGMAGTTGLEPATSDVTGRRSNQLNYVPEVGKYVGSLILT